MQIENNLRSVERSELERKGQGCDWPSMRFAAPTVGEF